MPAPLIAAADNGEVEIGHACSFRSARGKHGASQEPAQARLAAGSALASREA